MNFFTIKKFKTSCNYDFKENYKTTITKKIVKPLYVIVICIIFLKPQLLIVVLWLL